MVVSLDSVEGFSLSNTSTTPKLMVHFLQRHVCALIIVFGMIGVHSTCAQIVNDPLFDQQGYMETANVTDAWSFTSGDSNQTIAIVGGGNVLPTHEDLEAKTTVKSTGVVGFGAALGSPIPYNEQPPFATAAAGVAAASTNNNLGIAGVNWNASILSYNPAILENISGFTFQRLDPGAAANQLTQSIDDGANLTITAFTYFRDPYPSLEIEIPIIGSEPVDVGSVSIPAKIVNVGNSLFGFLTDLLSADSAISNLYSSVANAVQNDHLIIAPAGDFAGPAVGLPAATSRWKGAISVGSTDEEDIPSGFSPSSDSEGSTGATIDLVAPGEDATTTFNEGDDSYGEISTTHVSAGLVAGAASLLQSYNENLTAEDIRQVLRRTARPIGDPGFNPATGFGALDVEAALEYVDERIITQGVATNGIATLEEENTQLTAIRTPIWGEVASGTYFADRYRVEFFVDLPEGSQHEIWLRPVGTKGWSQAETNNQMPDANFEIDLYEGEATITTWVYDREVCDVLGRCYTTSLPVSTSQAQVAYTVATEPGSPPPPPALEVTLSGPTYVDSGQSGIWTANVEGGEGAISNYNWEYQNVWSSTWQSLNCTGSSCGYTFTNDGDLLDTAGIRATVTKGNETETGSQVVSVGPGDPACEPGGGIIQCPSIQVAEISSFEAEPQGESAQLAWSTTGTMGEGSFLVQHRSDSTAAWNDYQTVEGSKMTQADSTSAPTYRIDTDALALGTHQFQLKWEVDGETALLSEIVEAKITLNDPYRLRAYPNPVQSQLTIEGAVDEQQHVRVQIYDVLGRRVTTVYDGPMAPNELNHFMVQPAAEGLSSGTYFLRMTGEQFQTTTQISVVR